MHAIPVFLVVVVGTLLLLVAGVFFEGKISRGLSRRWPGFAYNSGAILMVGLLVLAAFAFGLLVMYAWR